MSPPPADPFDKTWVVDVVLGYPTGVRAQHGLGDGLGRDWLVEGLVGVEFIYPMAGGGFRHRFKPLCGEHDAFTVSPGLDAYLLYNLRRDFDRWYRCGPTTIELFTADVEVQWEHDFSDRCCGHIGIKLGAGAGYGNRWGVVPVAGIFLGCRF